MDAKKAKYLRELNDELRVTKIWRRQSPKQEQFSRSTKPIRAFFAGNRVGKTHVGAQEIARFIFNSHETRKIKLPVNIWCTCPSFDQQRETTQAMLEQMIAPHRIKDITYIKKGVWGRVEIDNGSVISFKSYDQGREKFQGVGKNLIWFDEEPPRDIWEECFVRVEAGTPLEIMLTMTPINGMCFDAETTLLSRRGWVGINEIRMSDQLLAYDPHTKTTKWSKITGFYMDSVQDHDMIRIHSKRTVDFLVTPDHKWVLEDGNKVQTQDIQDKDKLVRYAPYGGRDVEAPYTDSFISLVGWCVTDGSYRNPGIRIKLYQSWSANRKKSEEILGILRRTEPTEQQWNYKLIPYHSRTPNGAPPKKDGVAMHVSINGDLARSIRAVNPNKGTIDYEWISALSQRQLYILFSSMIAGDGHDFGDKFTFGQHKDRESLCITLQYIATLLGMRSSLTRVDDFIHVNIATPQNSQRPTRGVSLKKEIKQYSGVIWCPQTEYGTVVAKRRGRISVSSNTYIYDEVYLNDSKDIEVITAGWRDNPWLTKDQIEQMSRGLSDEALKVRQEGKFVRQTGLVCPWWNRDMLRSNLEIATSDNMWRVIDFGWSSSKTCVLWLGINSRDEVYVYDGIYENELEDEKLAQIILEREADQGIKITKSIGDNQPDRLDILRRNGVRVKPIDKVSGVDNWDEFRAEAMTKVGKNGFRVSNRLTMYDPKVGSRTNWFVKEIESTRWKSKKAKGKSKVMQRWDKESVPIKGSHADAIDTFSYFCAEYIRKANPYVDKQERRRRRQRRSKRTVINPITGY